MPPEPVFNNMGQQMLGPDSSIGKSIRHEYEDWGFESSPGRDICCLKNVDTFLRTPVKIPNVNYTSKNYLDNTRANWHGTSILIFISSSTIRW